MRIIERLLHPTLTRYKTRYYSHYHEFGRTDDATLLALKNKFLRAPKGHVEQISARLEDCCEVDFHVSIRDLMNECGKPDVHVRHQFGSLDCQFLLYPVKFEEKKAYMCYFFFNGMLGAVLTESGKGVSLPRKGKNEAFTSIFTSTAAAAKAISDPAGNLLLIEKAFTTRTWIISGKKQVFESLSRCEPGQGRVRNRYAELVAAAW